MRMAVVEERKVGLLYCFFFEGGAVAVLWLV